MTRFLSSRRNIIGALAGLATLALHLGLVAARTAGLGFLWPVAVVGMYAVGATLAGRDRADLHVGSGEVELGQLRRDFDALRTRVRKYGSRLPADVQGAWQELDGTIGGLLQRGEALATNAEALHVVGRTINDYLPTSLETYLNLPRTFATQRRIEGRRTAHEELLSQLGILQTELTRISDAVFAGEARHLADQGRFLEDKFRRSELDMN